MRGLTRIDGRSNLPPVTPLLRKGDARYAEQRFNGVLPGGIDGSLCLYTYEETSHDSDGNRQTTYVHYTIAMTQLPDTAPYSRELYCQRRVGFRFMDSAEDVFRKRQRVEQESEAVDKRYEIFIGEQRRHEPRPPDPLPHLPRLARQHSPEAYAFELCAGSLVCNVKGHKKTRPRSSTRSARPRRRSRAGSPGGGRRGVEPSGVPPPAQRSAAPRARTTPWEASERQRICGQVRDDPVGAGRRAAARPSTRRSRR